MSKKKKQKKVWDNFIKTLKLMGMETPKITSYQITSYEDSCMEIELTVVNDVPDPWDSLLELKGE